MSHSFEDCKKEGPTNTTHQRYQALRFKLRWNWLLLYRFSLRSYVSLQVCVIQSEKKSIRSTNPDAASLKFYPEPGLYRLVSFAFLVRISWNTQSSLQAREKWPSFQRVKLSTLGQDQSKKFIKSGFQTQRYNHKNCYNWSMQAGSLYVFLVKAESYASEARLRAKNLSDSNDKSTYGSGQYTLVYLSTLFTKFKKRYSQRGWHTTKSRAHWDGCNQPSLKEQVGSHL